MVLEPEPGGGRLRHLTDLNFWSLLWEADGILVLVLVRDGVPRGDGELILLIC